MTWKQLKEKIEQMPERQLNQIVWFYEPYDDAPETFSVEVATAPEHLESGGKVEVLMGDFILIAG